jgi:hypothetical protein
MLVREIQSTKNHFFLQQIMSNSQSRGSTKCATDESIDAMEGDVEVRTEDLNNNAAPPLSDREMLRRVLAMITPDRTSVLSMYGSTATHVKQLQLMTSAIETCHATLERVTEQNDILRRTVLDAFQARPLGNGPITRAEGPRDNGQQITRAELVTIFDDFFTGIQSDIQTQIASLNVDHRVGVQRPLRVVKNQIVQAGQQNAATTITTATVTTMYSYADRFWDVPEGFVFPAGVKRDAGWKLWLQGMPAYTRVGENGERIPSPIKPFRDLAPRRLPKKLADTYNIALETNFSIDGRGNSWR